MLNTANRLMQPSTDARKATLERWPLISVLAVWAVMVGALLSGVAIYGRNVPWREDWYMVPALVGKEPHLLEWLWAQTMEHRTPIHKAVYLILLRASGGDFRSGMIFDVLSLGGICLAMILIARHLRGGQTLLSDVVFPLLFLNLGHAEHIFLGNEIQFLISTGLVCTWLLIIAAERWPLSPRVAVIAGATLVLLPLSGGHGLVFTPFVALWLTAGTLLYRRDMTARWIVPFQSGCVILTIVLVGIYFVGYQPLTPHNPGIRLTMITAVRLGGMALGPVAAGTGRIFPESLIGILFCGVACLLWVSGIIPLSRGLRSICSAERFRVFGFVMFLAAMAALILATAWGRAAWVLLWGMLGRYALLSVPGLCAVYFAWLLYGPDTMRNRVEMAFAIAALLALPFNVQKGLGWVSGYYVTGMQAFEQDMANSLSSRQLAEMHQFLLPWDPEALRKGMQMLQEAKIGLWKNTLR